MFENEIIMQGERLKRIREMYHITQKEMSKGICTRNNLSQIENNRQKLSFNLAVELADRFNEIINKKGVEVKSITAEFLMKDVNEQANDVFTSILKNLEEVHKIDVAEEQLCKAEILIEKYKIPDTKKIELYNLMTDIYYNKYQYAKSNEMCTKGLKICINSKNIEAEVEFYLCISRNSIKCFHYNEALIELNYAERLNNSICNAEFSELIYYNKGLAYKKLEDYDNALKYLGLLKKMTTQNETLLIKARIVFANCLNEQHKFEEAEKEYLETLDLANHARDNNFVALCYKNLSELYYNRKKYKDAKRYIIAAMIPNNEYLNEIYYFAAKVLQNLNEDIEEYLLLALDICEKSDRENSQLIEKIIYELIVLYTVQNNEPNLVNIIEKLDKLNIDLSLIYPVIIGYYMEKDIEKGILFNKKYIERIKHLKVI